MTLTVDVTAFLLFSAAKDSGRTAKIPIKFGCVEV
jgi:hypothetical protein